MFFDRTTTSPHKQRQNSHEKLQTSEPPTTDMQQGNKSAGRQLSKAERYRWIIQEPKQPATPQNGQNSGLRAKKGTFAIDRNEILIAFLT